MSRDADGEASLSRIAALAGVDLSNALAQSFRALDPATPADYRALATLLVADWSERKPRRVGLGGGQGAGKSTLAKLVRDAGERVGLRIGVLGLDDFYLGKERRRELAARVHPLFETRGPPGTHDVEALRETLRALLDPGEIQVPVFDKGLDDRVAPRRLRGPFDLVLLEGWCVGARPSAESALESPINALEAERDPDGTWRRRVNDCLGHAYVDLWDTLDRLVYLRVPDLAAVRRWREQQDASLPAERRLGPEGVARFVEYFERITRSMWEDLPARADLTVELAGDHSIAGLRRCGS